MQKDHTSLYQKLYIKSAKKLGLKYKIFNSFIYDIYYKNKKIRFYQATASINDSVAYLISNKKNITNILLNKFNLPTFKQYSITGMSNSEIIKHANKIKFPIILKPNDGHGGEGIITDIKNSTELIKKVNKIKKEYRYLLIEKYYTGYDHRILICNNKVLAVTKRFPARVKGNGSKSIKELINQKNKKLLFPIEIDEEILTKLKSQRLTLKHIPQKDKIVYLRNRSNSHLGGTSLNLDLKTIHQDYMKICLKVMDRFKLKFAGIDFMSTDMTKSYKKTGGAITEINCNPGISMQGPSAENPINNIAEQVLINLFKIKRQRQN